MKRRTSAPDESAADHEVQGELARKSTASQQAIKIVLPVVVIGLMLWRFCALPSYAPSPLSPDWTPGCDEWDITWHELPIPQQKGRVTTQLVKGNPDIESALLVSVGDVGGQQIHRVDATTYETLATSSTYAYSVTPYCDGTRIRIHDGVTPITSLPSIYWLDPMTLTEQRRMTLSNLPTDATRIGLGTLVELPGHGLAGTMVLDPQAYSTTAYFRADATGHIEQTFPLYAMGEGPPTFWPERSPTMWISRWETSPGKMHAYDMQGGWFTYPPEAARHESTVFSHRRSPLIPRVRGWTSLRDFNVFPITSAFGEPYIKHPIIFGRFPPDEPVDDADKLTEQVAQLRADIWHELWTEDQIEAAGDRAYRLSGLIIRGNLKRPERRIIQGELAESVAAQPLVDPQERALWAGRDTGIGSVSVTPSFRPTLNLGLALYPLTGGHQLMTQVLTRFPKVSDAPAIMRIGLLREEATAVEWLGWVALPNAPDRESAPQIEIQRDRLIIHQPGLHDISLLDNSAIQQPFRWATLPMPSALADLPEGPLR